MPKAEKTAKNLKPEHQKKMAELLTKQAKLYNVLGRHAAVKENAEKKITELTQELNNLGKEISHFDQTIKEVYGNVEVTDPNTGAYKEIE